MAKSTDLGKSMNKTGKARGPVPVVKDDIGGIDFVRLAPVMGGLSLLLTIVSLALFLTKGFNYGIDFAGGTEVHLKFSQSVSAEQLREAMHKAGIGDPSVQSFGEANEFLVRLGTPEANSDAERNALLNKNIETLKSTLASTFKLQPEGILRIDTVGPQIGSELKKNGLLAAFYSLLVLLIYISVRFDYIYAPGAILCLVHDSVLTLGLFSFLGREVNVQIMAAVLTLIGYSLNDTIVTFDRIRETAPQNREKSLRYIINKAITDTLGRTVLTASATMLACIGLYFFGGGVIADIAFTLIVGIIVGTYSSIYVAAPLILVMEKLTPSQAIPHAQTKTA